MKVTSFFILCIYFITFRSLRPINLLISLNFLLIIYYKIFNLTAFNFINLVLKLSATCFSFFKTAVFIFILFYEFKMIETSMSNSLLINSTLSFCINNSLASFFAFKYNFSNFSQFFSKKSICSRVLSVEIEALLIRFERHEYIPLYPGFFACQNQCGTPEFVFLI